MSSSLALSASDPGRKSQALPRAAAWTLEHLGRALGFLAALVLAAMLGLVVAGFVLRYGFSSSIMGAEDAGTWGYVLMTAFGAPLGLNTALAMRLDVLHALMPRRIQSIADVVGEALTLLSGLVLAHGSFIATQIMGGTNASLGLPNWIPFALFGLAGGLVMLFAALRLLAEGRVGVLVAALVLALAGFWTGLQGFRFDPGVPPSIALGLIVMMGLIVAAPLPHAFIAAAFLVSALGSPLPEPAMINAALSGMMKFLLLAIPFFLLAGVLLTKSGVAGRLVAFADSVVGHMPGGLAQTTLLTNVLFSGASGSSIASAAFGANTFQPELEARGYPRAKAGAIIASTSVLDNVIPPSIAFLILATATNLSVGQLLLGGLWGGLLLALALFVVIRLTCRDMPVTTRSSGRDRGRLALRSIPAFGLGLIVVFGIRLGLVTTTEAAGIAALYTFLLSLLFGVPGRDLLAAFRQAATEAAAIALLIASAAPFAFLLAVDNISGMIGSISAALGSGPVAALAVSVGILLLAGLVLDIGAAILLFGPLLLPIATGTGLDPIQFGVIMVVTLMIGGLTPPFGVLVFVVSGVTRIPTGALFRAVLPHVAALCIALLAICLFALGWAAFT
ncbi:TRAP transporter large permease subunit [Celeribacter indicus]|uniref:TRAP dicarboxylate transporter subunit DctM n=1 Tax=Celeribacter indicus TaxID=1208324 RepID=A0A0B5E8W8_9RHOB|nr:TRAP transporter large permease subunit [Celeribacter indicus]AJE48757.1 TRAP dicarboxylate transporter subunit DctM [Celeribacter indicus]SDX11320.1 TRAP transporter, DctM subunit [Celeribacter indicus]